jgi:hypothetical protein
MSPTAGAVPKNSWFDVCGTVDVELGAVAQSETD